VAASRAAKDLPRAELVRLMMGQRDGAIAESSGESAATPQNLTMQQRGDVPVLAVRDLRLEAPGVAPLHGVSFAAAAGEIVGLAGLRGSGASEVLAALFGAFGSRAHGDVRIDGAPLAIETPARAIAAGLMFLANDRRKTVLYDLSVSENITLSRLAELARWGVLPLAEEARLAKEMIDRLRVVTPSLETAARALSGGNQQKVALLRCVAAGPRALLCDEPTRGVDVSAKADIHRSLRALAAAGKALVVVGSELLELLELCDRIVVMWRGRVTKTLEKKDFSREGLRLALDLERAPPGEETASGAAE
jgi:ABC-type sugar transport system ATPase subunit